MNVTKINQQYLLLGGLEDKYQKMYIKTIKAIRKWMVYRPMVPANRDILFTGSLSDRGGVDEPNFVLTAEVEHLTCFIGGMVGMAAKIFDIEGDMELAKKLTDGCVWSYNSTPSGIMPEGGNVFACESIENCAWNETAYHRALDPSADSRAQDLEQYITNKKAVEEEEREREAGAAKAPAGETSRLSKAEEPSNESSSNEPSGPATSKNGTVASQTGEWASLSKRGSAGSIQARTPPSNKKSTPADRSYQQKSEKTEAELQDVSATGRNTDSSHQGTQEPLRDPLMPFTHEQYVENMIKQEGLPRGYVSIRDKRYILR